MLRPRKLAVIILFSSWHGLVYGQDTKVDKSENNQSQNTSETLKIAYLPAALSEKLLLDHTHIKRPAHSFFGFNYLSETYEDEQRGFLSYDTKAATYFASLRIPQSELGLFTLGLTYSDFTFDLNERNLIDSVDFTFPSRQTIQRWGVDLGGSLVFGSNYAISIKLKSIWLKERYFSLVFDRDGKSQYYKGGLSLTKILDNAQFTLSHTPRLVTKTTNVTIRSAPSTAISYHGQSDRWSYLLSLTYVELSQVYTQSRDALRWELTNLYQIVPSIRFGLSVSYQPAAFKQAAIAAKNTMQSYGGSAHIDLLAYDDATISLNYDVKQTRLDEAKRRLRFSSQDIAIYFNKTL